jgi:hypothetical protein
MSVSLSIKDVPDELVNTAPKKARRQPADEAKILAASSVTLNGAWLSAEFATWRRVLFSADRATRAS